MVTATVTDSREVLLHRITSENNVGTARNFHT